MKTIKQMLDTLLSPNNTVTMPDQFEAFQEYRQAQYFADSARYKQTFSKIPSESNTDERNAMWNYLSAALRGHPQAQYELGMAYFLGQLGLAKDQRLAEQWLKRAAERGHIGAQEQLNEIYQFSAFS